MSRIEEFSPKNCQMLEQEIQAAVEAIGEKFGLQVRAPGGKLADDGSCYQVNCQLALPPRKETVATLKEEQDYLQYAQGFGVRASWLGKEFQRGHFGYTVVGLRVNEQDKCIILKRSDGSRCYENGKLVARHLG